MKSLYQNIKINNLTPTIKKMLNSEASRITEEVKKLSETTAQELTKNTKKDAPVYTKEFKKHIANKKIRETSTNVIYVWYVKDPEYRITHLIAKGHKLVVGSGSHNRNPKEVGKTRANDFLEKNVVDAQKKFIRGVKKIIEL